MALLYLPSLPAPRQLRQNRAPQARFPCRRAGLAPVRRSDVAAGRREESARRYQDRKRVVSGKSVSVRVDLGGRRIIKKKNSNKDKTYSKMNTKSKKLTAN